MSTRRNDQRRRRVILDDVLQSGSTSVTTNNEVRASEATKLYSDKAKRRSQLKFVDLIPKRRIPLAGVIVGCLLFVVLLNGLAIYLGGNSDDSNRQIAFRLSGVGSLSNWFSSLLFMMTGLGSILIYGMRRHRCDDYTGHYRVWLMVAALFFAASVHCVVDFRSVLASWAAEFGWQGERSLVVFLLVKFVALTTIVVRGAIEIKASRAATIAVVIAWSAYVAAIVGQIPGVKKELVQSHDVVLGNLTLIGNMATFISVMFYSRFVYFHANNLVAISERASAIPVRRSKTQTNLASKNSSKRKKATTNTESSASAEVAPESIESTERPIIDLRKSKAKSGSRKTRSAKQRRRAA